MRLLMACRRASMLLSPMLKAMIEPIMTPQMPPIAIPSRNIRLRKNVNIDHLFQKIYLLQLNYSLCFTPQAFEAGIFSLFFPKKIYKDITKIQQNPAKVRDTFSMENTGS